MKRTMVDDKESIPEFGGFPTSFVDVLKWRAEQEPERTAYIYLSDGETSEESITYKELDSRARSIAANLQEESQAGQRALLVYPPGLDFLSAFLGCLYANIVAVPVYPPRKDKDLIRIMAVIDNSEPRFGMTTAPILSRFQKVLEDADIPQLRDLRWVATDSVAGNLSLAGNWKEPVISGDDLAFLQYTSGSTSLPKGVMVSHGNLIYNQRMLTPSTAHSKDSILISWLPLYHDMGLIGNILHPLYIGFKCIFMSPEAFLQRPLRWLDAITRYRATTTGGAPNFAYELCVNRVTTEQRQSLDLSTWEFALVGSDTVRHSTLERFAEAFEPCGFRKEAFYPAYGLAEATLIVSGGEKAEPPHYLTVKQSALQNHRVEIENSDIDNAYTLVGCGKTLLDQEIVIVDPEKKTPCGPDEIGEIWVRGKNVARGYWNNDEQTKELLRAEIKGKEGVYYLRTGDLGFLRDEELYITGRLKNMIIIRGRNHYPHDIELTVESSVQALRAGCSAAFTIEVNGEERLVVIAELERRFMTDRRKKAESRVPIDQRASSDRRRFNEEDTGFSEIAENPILDEAIQTMREAVAEEHGLQVHSIVLIRPVSLPKTTSGKIRRLDAKRQFLEGKLIEITRWEEQVEKEVTQTKQLHSRENIRAWLISKLSVHLKMARHQIHPKTELSRYGLDSLAAVSISGELGEWLETTVSPTLFYNYPTVESIAAHLAGGKDKTEFDPGQFRENRDAAMPIAIIGAACRFPGSADLAGFRDLLKKGIDAISEVPAERWDPDEYYDSRQGVQGKMNTRWGGFLTDIDRFDPFFFGISPREAAYIDPQHRLLLETSWLAFENAGLSLEALTGSRTGVFVGISNNEYARLALQQPQELNVYQGTGNALSIAANRLSYHYDLHGPSLSLDTACSSSLVAVHLACQSLRNGEAAMALAGGVNLILSPETTLIFSQAGMMAADGRCKTFDDSADGYVRSEGCGLVVLKPLPDAERDGDDILAVIRGSAINQDGRSNGITAPNALSQQEVIDRALANARIKPSQVSFVEAHGTGTSLGDPVEMDSLKAVYMRDRTADRPCLIGSVKTNIGHLESAAGVAGLIKAVLCVKEGRIPPNLHFKKLNPHISLDNTPFTIPVSVADWPPQDSRRIAGVSSFGFGGTNAHLIVEEYSGRKTPAFDHDFPAYLFTLSARNQEALKALAGKYIPWLEELGDGRRGLENLAHTCFSGNVCRTHFDFRIAMASDSTTHIRDALAGFLEGNSPRELLTSTDKKNDAPKIAFIFSDSSGRLLNTCAQLYKTQPSFKVLLDECDETAHKHLNLSPLSLLYEGMTPSEDQEILEWVARMCLEISLAKLLMSWGIEPDAVFGSGLGEYSAACISNIMTLREALILSCEQLKLSRLSRQNTTDAFQKAVAKTGFLDPNLPFISSVTGRSSTQGQQFKKDYWLAKPAQTTSEPEGVTTLMEEEGITFFLETAAGSSFEELLQAGINDGKAICLSTQKKDVGEWQQLLNTLSRLYVEGFSVDWPRFYGDYPYLEKIPLPNYPFQRKRYWIDEPIPVKTSSQTNYGEDNTLYRISWKPLQPSKPDLEPADHAAESLCWLIFEDRQGIGNALSGMMEKEGFRFQRIQQGKSFHADKSIITMRPDDPADYVRLFEHLPPAEGKELGVIHLWNLDLAATENPDIKSLRSALRTGTISVLHLLQAAESRSPVGVKSLLLVTSNTQRVESLAGNPVSIAQSPVWGLGKSIALEYPEVKVKLVDMDDGENEDSALQLYHEMIAPDGEWLVALRNRERYGARLARLEQPLNPPSGNPPGGKTSTWLITGGSGKLGLQVADYLVGQGVEHLVLLSRSSSTAKVHPDSAGQSGHTDIVRRLADRGATISVFQADVADPAAMKRVFDDIHQSMPPLKGVVHAAGVVSKTALATMDREEFESIVKAKVDGTWVLHQLSAALELDYFILFSSISSVWGSKEIGHYAAANAFLDAFSTYRKNLSLPVLSINWGPWSDGGMTDEAEQSQLAKMGIGSLNRDKALEILDTLLQTDLSNAIAVPLNPRRMYSLYGTIGYESLFEEFSQTPGDNRREKEAKRDAPPAALKQWVLELSNVRDEERRRLLVDYMKEETAAIMKCRPTEIDPDAGFFEMGMDSIMAVELKEILEEQTGHPIDSTVVFDYPSLNRLAAYLLSEVINLEKPLTSVMMERTAEENETGIINPTPGKEVSNRELPPDTPERETRDDFSNIENLTEQEIEKLIEQELKDI